MMFYFHIDQAIKFDVLPKENSLFYIKANTIQTYLTYQSQKGKPQKRVPFEGHCMVDYVSICIIPVREQY